MKDEITKINKILKEHNLGEIQQAYLDITPDKINDQATLQKKIKDFIGQGNEVEGWLCLTDEVMPINKGDNFTPSDTKIVLYGELTAGKESLHIRQAENGWLANTLTLEDSGKENMIMFKESFISTDHDYRLKYEVFWKEIENPVGQIAMRPYASRFAGFEKEGK